MFNEEQTRCKLETKESIEKEFYEAKAEREKKDKKSILDNY